jgi:hypothetical protein
MGQPNWDDDARDDLHLGFEDLDWLIASERWKIAPLLGASSGKY